MLIVIIVDVAIISALFYRLYVAYQDEIVLERKLERVCSDADYLNNLAHEYRNALNESSEILDGLTEKQIATAKKVTQKKAETKRKEFEKQLKNVTGQVSSKVTVKVAKKSKPKTNKKSK